MGLPNQHLNKFTWKLGKTISFSMHNRSLFQVEQKKTIRWRNRLWTDFSRTIKCEFWRKNNIGHHCLRPGRTIHMSNNYFKWRDLVHAIVYLIIDISITILIIMYLLAQLYSFEWYVIWSAVIEGCFCCSFEFDHKIVSCKYIYMSKNTNSRWTVMNYMVVMSWLDNVLFSCIETFDFARILRR